MRTLKTILATLFFVALTANSNAQSSSWNPATNGIKLTPGTANAGIGNDPLLEAKLHLHNSVSTTDGVFGLNMFTENTNTSSSYQGNLRAPMYGIYSTNTNHLYGGLYGAYFKNTQLHTGTGPAIPLYGVYTDNVNSTYAGPTYGFFAKNTSTTRGAAYGFYTDNSSNNSSIATAYGFYAKNQASSGITGTAYGFYAENTTDTGSSGSANAYGFYAKNTNGGSGGAGTFYGAYLDNKRTSGSGTIYGLYSTNTSNATGPVYGAYLSAVSSTSSAVYGLYSIVSDGAANERWAGYFTGGNVAVMEGNVSIGAATVNNDQGWQRVMDVYSLESSKLLIRSNTVKTGIFSHNTWNGMVGRIGTESTHDLRLMAGYGNDVITLKTDGNVGIGCDPGDASLRIRNTTFPNFVLEGANTRLQIGVAIGNGSFAPYSKTGDIVYRPLGNQHGLIFNLANNNNDGNSYIKFGDDGNGGWFSIYNNKKVQIDGNVGIGASNPSQALTVQGRIAVYPQGTTSDDKYNGNLIITKPTNSGQYINLIRQNNHPWSIGTVYSDNAFAIGTGKEIDAQFTNPFFTIKTSGDVGIGTINPTVKLEVAGTVRAREFVANLNAGADFVFEESYTLRTLDEVHNFIRTNKHLPEIPSATDMVNNGLEMGEFQIKLLQKMEELTLYVIEQDNKLKLQQEEISRLKNR